MRRFKGAAGRFNLFISLIYFFSLPPLPLFLLLEDYSSYLLCLHISANPIESTRALSAGYELSLRDLEKKKEGGGGGEGILIYFFKILGFRGKIVLNVCYDK